VPETLGVDVAVPVIEGVEGVVDGAAFDVSGGDGLGVVVRVRPAVCAAFKVPGLPELLV
jgi:hypothetical protein